MAKLRIRGDTSGYVDIAAPAVAGTTTVNLDKIPQTDQAVQFNKGSAGTLATFTDGVNSNFVIETASLITTIGNTGGSTALAFKSANTENMRIDAAGRVTMPYQPIFSARTYAGNGTVVGGFTGIQFSNIFVNQGSHWNNTTGVFTCPVAGKYFVTLNLNLKSADNNWMGAYVVHNGTIVLQGWSASAANFSYQPALCIGVINCQTNDTISLGFANAYLAPSGGSLYNHAVIQLIG